MSAAPSRRTRFVSFDGAIACTAEHQRPDRYRHLEADLGKAKRIARGAGLSYAAASFAADSIVQEMTAFNRLLDFDENARTVKVEAGVAVGDVLEWALARNLYLPVLPGYPTITVGGCIAADVHGKNPLRDGTFADYVRSFRLYHPNHGFQEITPNGDPDRFGATCGGFGLTGTIVNATLQLAPLNAHGVAVSTVAVTTLNDAVDVLRNYGDADFAYSWHDGAARGQKFGQGVIFVGRWTEEQPPTGDNGYEPMDAWKRAALPFCAWNRVSTRVANAAFGRMARRTPVEVKDVFGAAFPFARRTAYHRLYGRSGLAEIQVLVPEASAKRFAAELAKLVNRLDPPLTMMSLKLFRGGQRALGMSGSGCMFALDFIRKASTSGFLSELDALVIDTGAQPNLTKDSRLPGSIAARTLPHFAAFCSTLARLDPDRLYHSELSARLHL